MISFGFLQLVNVAGAWHTRKHLVKMKRYHGTVRLLVWSVGLQFLSYWFGVIFWGHLMDVGSPAYAWLTLYKYAQALSGYLLVLLLVAIAKGWTIVRAALSPLGCLKIAGYATIYLCCIIFSETYQFGFYQYERMPGYYYDNPAGDWLLVLKCGLAPFWILYAVNTTVQNFNKKRRFYSRFAIAAVVWCVLPAIFVAIAYALPPVHWIVYNFVWENVLLFSAQYCLLLMYNPLCNLYNASYPFHQDNLTHLTNIPWKADPTINKSYLNASRASKNSDMYGAAGTGSNKFNFLGSGRADNVNIADVFAAIRNCSQGM